MKCVRLPFVLLLLLVCAQLAGPWGWNTAAGGEVIRQGVLIPYEIKGPEGWIYRAEPHQYVLGVFKPEDDVLYPYISLTVVGGAFHSVTTGGTINQDISPEALLEANLYERPGARLLSSDWLGEEDNQYLVAEFSWSSTLGEIRSIKAFHPWEDSVLVVTAASLADEFEEYREQFIESMMSMRVKTRPGEKKRGKASDEDVPDDAWLYSDR